MRKRSSILFCLLFFLASLPRMARAAGYEFEGIGARQVGRAGAAVADVSDWTAIYWNPAGMAAPRLDGETNAGQVGFEAFGGYARTKDGNSLSRLAGPLFNEKHMASSFILGAFGVRVPLESGWVLGTGVYTPLIQGADFNDTANGMTLDYFAQAGIAVVNFSVARVLWNDVTLGAGVNAVYAQMRSNSRLTNSLSGTVANSDIAGDGWGPEGILGLQWRMSSAWRFGAVYRTGSRIPLKGDADASMTGLPDERSTFGYDFNHPATAAVGVSFTPVPKATLSFDINHTNWRSFRGDMDFETSGPLLSDIRNSYAWKNTFKFRLGGLYRLTDKTDLLAGLSYDNYALDRNSIDFSTTIDVPIFRYFGGVTRRLPKGWEMSASLLAAKGRREKNGVDYSIGGWQAMVETAWNFSTKHP
ncbi:MAG TPA: outer membrane protein transport protein [Elusimicrobiota bacterium]|nr:outer membrane protein transport protein [Elusimicrobiota bacterium]